MAIVAGFDVHRAQIRYGALDGGSGEVGAGRIAATAGAVRGWVARFGDQQVEVALEACTGWLFVCEAPRAAGARPQLADAAETGALRGKKRRAKTGRADARLLCRLLAEQRLPESWIAPAHVDDWRERTRLRTTLVDERTARLQRLQATLFQHGVAAAAVPGTPLGRAGRAFRARLALSAGAQARIETALALVDAIDAEPVPLAREPRRLARRQPGCRVPRAQLGVGERTALTIVAELGDVARLAAAGKAVRRAGLDVAGHRSHARSPPGRLSRPRLTAAAPGARRGRAVGDARQQSRPPRLPGPQPSAGARTRAPRRRSRARSPAAATTTPRELGPAALAPLADRATRP
jgi:transposase